MEQIRHSDGVSARETWIMQVQELCTQVRGWAEEQGWRIAQGQIERNEEDLGIYSVPTLTIEWDQNKLILEPIARYAWNSEGRVDLFAYPAMDKVMLMRVGETWVPRIALGLTWPIAWGRECFIDLAHRLVLEP